ncbi:MAG: TonB C-terminal domain-containing protein [Candidatus Aminicenantes bacterium]|nr:MAG: TonB C-terminal domain-containing protein [Candidatus Aminicenantes bacterium]
MDKRCNFFYPVCIHEVLEENEPMRIRRTIFLLSVLLHLIVIYWIARVKIPLLIYPGKEKVIAIVPIASPPLPGTSPISPKSTANKKLSGKQTGFQPRSRPGTGGGGSTPTGTPTGPGQGIIETPPPKLIAPPLDVKSIPELSIYSENIRDILKDFERRRVRRGKGGTAVGVGDSDARGGEGKGLPAGESQAFFNIENYDLTPWAKQVLRRIQSNWIIPLVAKKQVEQPVEITVVIEKDGKISFIEVKQSSNSDAFDRAAMNALTLSAPLPGLPGDFPDKNLEARFMFTSHLQ